MKKLVLCLLLSVVPVLGYSELNIQFKPVINALLQFNNPNYISAGTAIQLGVDFNINNYTINLSGEIDITTGYPYGFEYHIGSILEFNSHNIGIGIGYLFYGNLFPMIKGTGYGSDFFNLHCLRFHISLTNNNIRLTPYISLYFDSNNRHINNNIKIDKPEFGFGFMVGFLIKNKKIQKNTEYQVIEIPVDNYIEIEKPVYIERQQLYDSNGWFLQYDVDTGIANWIHNPDLTKVLVRPPYAGFSW